VQGEFYSLERGTFARLTDGLIKNGIIFGLNWTCGGNVDLDVGVIATDAQKNKIAVCNTFNKEKINGVRISTDDLTGAGGDTEDNENVRIQLCDVDSKIKMLYIVVNIYTERTQFSDVSNAHIIMSEAGTKFGTAN